MCPTGRSHLGTNRSRPPACPPFCRWPASSAGLWLCTTQQQPQQQQLVEGSSTLDWLLETKQPEQCATLYDYLFDPLFDPLFDLEGGTVQ